MKGSLPIRKASLTSRKIAKSVAGFVSDKKAEDIVVLDMRKLVNFCDFFVICSGTSDRQVKALADAVEEGLETLGIKARYNHADKKPAWVVFDVGDVVVHIFQKDVREFYKLEYLWQDAKPVDWEA